MGGWWVLTAMGAKTVLSLAGAGVGGLGAGECWDPFAQGVLGWGGGQHPWQSCLVAGRGSAMRLAPSCMVSPPRGMLGGRVALTPLHSLSPRTRGWRKTSQTR